MRTYRRQQQQQKEKRKNITTKRLKYVIAVHIVYKYGNSYFWEKKREGNNYEWEMEKILKGCLHMGCLRI